MQNLNGIVALSIAVTKQLMQLVSTLRCDTDWRFASVTYFEPCFGARTYSQREALLEKFGLLLNGTSGCRKHNVLLPTLIKQLVCLSACMCRAVVAQILSFLYPARAELPGHLS